MTPAETFDRVVRAVADGDGVIEATMFGSRGLKVGTKFFAMLYKERLVLKLPADRVQELVASGKGDAFDPGHGRRMREWVSVPAGTSAQWRRLVEEARDFVAG